MAFKSYYKLVKYKDLNKVPFYVEDVSGQGGNINVYKRNGDATYVEYSADLESWTKVNMGNSPYAPYAVIPISPAGRVYMRSVATNYYGAQNGVIISYNRTYNVGGNIMSMLYGSNFTGSETVFPDNTKNSIFSGFFGNQSNLINASSLILPATTLAQNCYSEMFSGCAALTTAPALPATTLATSCYATMFGYCYALTAAPALPATTLAPSCYSNMFGYCRALTTAPALPATTLATSCYATMFGYCRALTTAPALPVTTLAQSCYYAMFQGCTNLTQAPELPATTLAQYCYNYMFQDCSNLNSITVGATSWNTNHASNWVQNVAATGTFTKPSATTIAEGTSGIPSGWTVVNV